MLQLGGTKILKDLCDKDINVDEIVEVYDW